MSETIIRCEDCGTVGELGVTWYGGCVVCADLEKVPNYTIVESDTTDIGDNEEDG